MRRGVHLGVDVGSTTVKIVVLDSCETLLAWRYLRARGQPRQTLVAGIEEISREVGSGPVLSAGLTGSGGGPIATRIGVSHTNELVAQVAAVGRYYPHVRTIIEIGGQDSKYMSVTWDEPSNKLVLADFAMNSLCAAGTGSFLDQQADRLGISVEDDFGRLALLSDLPARIAGRCTVFAKSDMIHLQQRGTPLPDILAGLGMALARNFKGVIGRGKAFTPPVLFQGGVAYNKGVVRAFERVLELEPGEIVVPAHPHLMPALGAAFLAMEEAPEDRALTFQDFATLTDTESAQHRVKKLQPLLDLAPGNTMAPMTPLARNGDEARRIPVCLGVDVGSVTTKVVVMDEDGTLLAHRYLPTAGRPLDAVQRGLAEVAAEVGEQVEVISVGATGSGRYLTADYIGADVVRSEITAQARAALFVDPTVDTIFEIGGQDSKYISLDNGAVVNFTMNTACAAGTGSFLEEQAEKLGISIRRDFSQSAFCSRCPMALGERCTVFMESDLVHHQQQGAAHNDLIAGLAYAVVDNYLNRVVNKRAIGRNVFFQGGVASNASVEAAFQARTGGRVVVPPHHQVSGAIGASLLAREEMARQAQNGTAPETRFKGFDLRQRTYEAQPFVCQACPNLCDINKVTIAGEPPIFYGARCDRFEEAGRKRYHDAQAIPDLFAEREAMLLGGYRPPSPSSGRTRVGIPRALIFHDMFPFWHTFFDALEMDIVLSAPTNAETLRATAEFAVVEACHPMRIMHGHVADLLQKEVDIVFMPSISSRENAAPGQVENTYCPLITSSPYLVNAAMNGNMASHGARMVTAPMHMLWETAWRRELKILASELGVTHRRVGKAARSAQGAQDAFYAALRQRGAALLHESDDSWPLAVLVGRPYNFGDPGLNQDLPYTLRKMGVLPVPMDFLPVETVDVSADHANMFWRSGQDILAAAVLIRQDPRLTAIYLTNFHCGPDSFLVGYFRQMMQGKPFLELEFDEHTADAGIITRCEAFFESLRMRAGMLS